MALTRARAMAGPADLCDRVEEVRRAVIADKADPAKVRADAAEMRARLAAAGRAGSTWAIKEGQGGLQDIELLGQAVALASGSDARATAAQLAHAPDLGWLDTDQTTALIAAHGLFARVQAAIRLLTDSAVDPSAIGEGGREFLARVADAPSADALAVALDEKRAYIAKMIDAVLGAVPRKEP
jgi:glutamate-ammonia-ligase adenylyltransferase